MSACPSSEDGETAHLPEGCTNPLWRPGSGDRIGLQGEGAGKKEAEAVQGGRATVAMEGDARYSGIRILTAGHWWWWWWWWWGGWLGKVMGKPMSFFCPWHFPSSLQTMSCPLYPRELAPLQPHPQWSPLCLAHPPPVQKAASGPFPGGLFTSTTTAN